MPKINIYQKHVWPTRRRVTRSKEIYDWIVNTLDPQNYKIPLNLDTYNSCLDSIDGLYLRLRVDVNLLKLSFNDDYVILTRDEAHEIIRSSYSD